MSRILRSGNQFDLYLNDRAIYELSCLSAVCYWESGRLGAQFVSVAKYSERNEPGDLQKQGKIKAKTRQKIVHKLQEISRPGNAGYNAIVWECAQQLIGSLLKTRPMTIALSRC